MCFAIVKGLSAIAGPLIAAALHPKYLESEAPKPGRGGWGGYGFNGISSVRDQATRTHKSRSCDT